MDGFEEKTDQEVVRAALRDPNAFAELVVRYEVALMRYSMRLGADMESAKDILQESFIKIYINLNDYNSSLSFSAWIYRITHNEAISHFRKQRVRPAPVKREADLALFEQIPDELDIVKEMDAKLASSNLTIALGSLESKYRDVLVLRFFEEKSYDEISDILQIPHGTVATNINRGKAKLLKLLKKHNVTDSN